MEVQKRLHEQLEVWICLVGIYVVLVGVELTTKKLFEGFGQLSHAFLKLSLNFILSVSIYIFYFLQIQRNLQLRIEEQGRCLQMLFEKQCKSGIDKLKASSADLDNPCALSFHDSPEKGEMDASKADHGKTGSDLVNTTKPTAEEGSQKPNMQQQEGAEDEAPEKPEPDIEESSSCHPTKRSRTDE